MKRSTLDELSLALSPQERTALLEKIRKSLSVHNTDRQEIYHRIQEEGQKKDIVAQEIRKMGFWERFILWIRNIFSTKTQEEIASEILVRRSLRKLRSSSHPVLERDTEFLTTFFAEEVFTLYKKLIVPNEAVLFFWEKPENLRRAVEFVMAGKVPEAKSSLFRFIQFDQLVELYGIHESRTVLKEKILNEVSTYLQTIPNEVFSFIEEGILPLYFMKKLSQFPFTSFFSLFRVDLDDYQEQSVPDFKPVSLAQALEYIEHLAYALYSASKTRECGTVHSELLSFYLVTNTELLLQEEDVPGHPDEIASVPKEQLEALNRAFTQTADHIEGFFNKISMADLLRVGYNDPFYRFIAYTPRLKIKDFYKNAITLRVLDELDTSFAAIRNEYLTISKKKIFRNELRPLINLENERSSPPVAGMTHFAATDALTTLYNFILQWFLPQQCESLRMVAKIIPPRMRDIENNLLFKSASLEDAAGEIERFDEGFSPETEDGKSYLRLQRGALQDITQQRAFRNLMAQRERSAVEIIQRYLDDITVLHETFDVILGSKMEALQEELRRPAPQNRIGFDALQMKSVSGEGVLPKTLGDYLKALRIQYTSIIKIIKLELLVHQEESVTHSVQTIKAKG